MKIAISGSTGRVGKTLIQYIELQKKHEICAALVRKDSAITLDVPTTNDIETLCETADVIIDYSRPELTLEVAKEASKQGKPLISGTTGFTSDQFELLNSYSKSVAILQAGNTSVGINLVQMLIKNLAKSLDANFDIEIIEKHHKHKVDAPSGTALMLAKSIANDSDIVYGRTGQRKAGEIGISSVRAGSIIGEHEIIFASDEEIITISHQAFSRNIFVSGAIKAAEWIIGKKPGLYSMEDVLR